MVRRSPRTGEGNYVTGRQPLIARPANSVLIDRSAAVAVGEQQRRPGRRYCMRVSPEHQSDERRPEVKTLLGQAVFVTRRVIAIAVLLEHTLVHQPK